MKRFEYVVTLTAGFTPTMQVEEEMEVKFIIEAKNRVTADRMISAMLVGAPNVKEWSGICID